MSASAGGDRPGAAGAGAAEERLFGVSLVDYAVVSAAVAEGFPLGDVLATEGIEPRAYAKAEVRWKERVAASGAEKGALLERYRAELATAEDRLARRIAPLDEDPAAWVAFLHAYSTAHDPGALLKSSGLGMNDMARLSRRWARRVEADAQVGKTIADLKARGAGPMPALNAEPPRLRPSPTARAQTMEAPGAGAPVRAHIPSVLNVISTEGFGLERQSALPPQPGEIALSAPAPIAPSPAAEARPGGFTVEQYASLCVEVQLYPARRAETLARYRITEGQKAEIDAAWGSRFQADPSARATYDQAVATYRAWLAAQRR